LATQADRLPVPPHSARIAGAALTTVLVLALGMALWASPAAANDRFDLDSQATTAGNMAEDTAGNAYIGWMDGGSPKFCKIPAAGTCTNPIALSLSGTGLYVPSQVHPVLGRGSTVYVVGPSYDGGGVDIWTSANGGESFGAPVVSTGSAPDMTEPNSVLLSGSEFLIGSSHVGAGFGEVPVSGAGNTGFEFAVGSAPYTGQANLALAAPGDPVETYWEDVDSSPINFSRYKGSGPLTSASDWTTPAVVTEGEAPRLSGGAAGLFLLSDDYSAGSPEADLVDVRKYSGTTFSFGSPLALSAGPAYDALTGGAIGQSPSGIVAVAWPQASGDAGVMQLYVSSNGGASFGAATDIANIGSGYESGDNAQLTLNNSGGGWLTFLDEEGLQVADLSPLPPSPPGTTTPTGTSSGSTSTAPKKTTPKPYTGATTTVSTPVGGELLTLKVPKACLAAEQPFYVGVGKEKRHGISRSLKTPITVGKVSFSFDGLKKTLKKKPFRWLIEPPALAAGHLYLVKARVTVRIDKHGVKKKVVKTLKGKVSIC
jgi:hypothetical protein